MHRRYHCNQCRKCLSSQQTLDNHRMTKGCLKKAKLISGIIIPDYSCPTCNIKILDPVNLEALSKLKLANIEPNKNARECDKCGETEFESNCKFERHIQSCDGTAYDSKKSCKICLYPFYDSNVFKQHRCQEKIRCQICHEFGTIAQVQMHLVNRLTIGEIVKDEKKTISINCCYDVVNKMIDSLPEKYLIAQGILPFWIHQDKDTSFRNHFILEFYWNSYHKSNPKSPLLIDVPKYREQMRLHCTGTVENTNKEENALTTEFERGKMPYSSRFFENDPQKKWMTLQWNQLYILQNLTLKQLADAHLDKDLQKRNSYAETIMKRKYEARMTPWLAANSKKEDFLLEGTKQEIWNLLKHQNDATQTLHLKMMSPSDYPYSECLFPLQPNFILNAMAPMHMYSETEIAIMSGSKVQREVPMSLNYDFQSFIATEPKLVSGAKEPPECLDLYLQAFESVQPVFIFIDIMTSDPIVFFIHFIFTISYSTGSVAKLALQVFHNETPYELNYLKVMSFISTLPEQMTQKYNYKNFFTHLFVLARWITSYLVNDGMVGRPQIIPEYKKEIEMTHCWRQIIDHILKTDHGIVK
jgi:hypothetical protein